MLTLKNQTRTPLFQILTGPTGSGKTHRLRALELEQAQARPDARVLRVAAAEVLALLIYSIRAEVHEIFRELGAELGWAGRLGLAMRTAPDAGLVRGAVNRWVATAL